jgi:hypothetical protein
MLRERKMSKIKRPDVGDRIRHTISSLDIVKEGTVVQLLSAQFVYETDDGYSGSCLFTGLWKEVKNGRKSERD